jgi:hypothetical protein
MTSKNPYELRYNIYQEAQCRLMEKFNIDHHTWKEFDYWKRDQESEGNKVTAVPPIEERPKFPTHEQILVEAEKIYSFVQQSS